MARLRSAAVLVRIGLDHEPWLARVLPTSKMLVVDASKTIRLLQTETPRLRVERCAIPSCDPIGCTQSYLIEPSTWLGITTRLYALASQAQDAYAARRLWKSRIAHHVRPF
jgi:ABC-type Zn uptake system ZnuABC Zn-binding protein ZnuA